MIEDLIQKLEEFKKLRGNVPVKIANNITGRWISGVLVWDERDFVGIVGIVAGSREPNRKVMDQ